MKLASIRLAPMDLLMTSIRPLKSVGTPAAAGVVGAGAGGAAGGAAGGTASEGDAGGVAVWPVVEGDGAPFAGVETGADGGGVAGAAGAAWGVGFGCCNPTRWRNSLSTEVTRSSATPLRLRQE